MKAVESFYEDSRACYTVRAGIDASECLSVNVGLRQGLVMSPWLLNVYVDGVKREVMLMCLESNLELCCVQVVAGLRLTSIYLLRYNNVVDSE